MSKCLDHFEILIEWKRSRYIATRIKKAKIKVKPKKLLHAKCIWWIFKIKIQLQKGGTQNKYSQ